MRKFFKTVNGISEWSGKIVSYLVYVGIIVLAIEVFARYFFNAPTVWAHGYSQRIFGSYFILVGAYTLLKGGHVRVDVLYNRFGLKGRAFLDMINYAVLLLWSSVLILEGWTFFAQSYKLREVDEMVLAHPVYPFKFLLLVGSILITLHGVALFIISLQTFVKGEKYEF
jgi:TRAP-type mannitol/chloroaromatic compound transport system permease small subunit